MDWGTWSTIALQVVLSAIIGTGVVMVIAGGITVIRRELRKKD